MRTGQVGALLGAVNGFKDVRLISKRPNGAGVLVQSRLATTLGDVGDRLLRWTVLAIAGLAAIVSLYVGAVLVLGLIPVDTAFESANDGIDVWVRSNGVHADLVLPATAGGVDWRLRLPIEDFEVVDDDHLAFGWGDRGVYLSTPRWSDLRSGTVFGALTGLDATVLHVELAPAPSRTPWTRHVQLTADQYRRLATFIDASFAVDPEGEKLLIADARYGHGDAFFEARGHYSIVKTCNEWTRQALASAGVRVTVWSPFDRALLYQLPD